MRKLALLLAIAMLIAAVAAAEGAPTRRETVRIEGVEEEIETVYFESSRGYSIWIDPNYLALQDAVQGDDVDHFAAQGDLEMGMEIYFAGGLDESLQKIADDVMDLLLDNYGQVEELDASGVFPNFAALGFFSPHDGICVEYYLVEVAGSAFHIVMTYPEEAAEGFAARVRAMLSSFEMIEVESVG